MVSRIIGEIRRGQEPAERIARVGEEELLIRRAEFRTGREVRLRGALGGVGSGSQQRGEVIPKVGVLPGRRTELKGLGGPRVAGLAYAPERCMGRAPLGGRPTGAADEKARTVARAHARPGKMKYGRGRS